MKLPAVALAVSAGLVVAAGVASGALQGISKVRVAAVSQPANKPVAFQIEVVAPVGHSLYLGFRVLDASRKVVYSRRAVYGQRYKDGTFRLDWTKQRRNGSPVTTGVRYYVEASAADRTTRGPTVWSRPVSFVLRG